ncbi:unnamed protein product, partial [Prorocentrum cordatum]
MARNVFAVGHGQHGGERFEGAIPGGCGIYRNVGGGKGGCGYGMVVLMRDDDMGGHRDGCGGGGMGGTGGVGGMGGRGFTAAPISVARPAMAMDGSNSQFTGGMGGMGGNGVHGAGGMGGDGMASLQPKAKAMPMLAAPMTAKSVQQKLQSGQLDQGDYDDTLDSYEKGMRGEAQRSRRREQHESGARRMVQATQGKELGISKNIGVFWPKLMWNEYAEQHSLPECHPKELQRLPTSDGMILGAVRDKSYGEPIGTYALTDELVNELRMVGNIADSKHMDQEDVDEVWNAAKKRKLARHSHVNIGTSEAPVLANKLNMSTRKGDDFSMLDALFEPASDGPSFSQSLAPASSTGVRAPASGAGAGQLNASEAVALTATQYIRALSDRELYGGVGNIQAESKKQLDAVQKRLGPGMAAIYSAGMVPGEADSDSHGMRIFSDLKGLESKLQSVMEYALRSDALPPDAGAVASAIAEVVHAALNGATFGAPEYVALLDPDGGPMICSHGINAMPETVQETTQRKRICSDLDALMSEKGNMKNVISFLTSIDTLRILADGLRVELDDLEKLALASIGEGGPMELPELKALQSRKRTYVGYMLGARATGLHIAQTVGNAILQMLADTQGASELNAAMQLIGEIGKGAKLNDGALALQKAKQWKGLFAHLCKFDASEDPFKQANKVNIANVRGHVDLAVELLADAFVQAVHGALGPAVDTLKAQLASHSVGKECAAASLIGSGSPAEVTAKTSAEIGKQLAAVARDDDPRVLRIKEQTESLEALTAHLSNHFPPFTAADSKGKCDVASSTFQPFREYLFRCAPVGDDAFPFVADFVRELQGHVLDTVRAKLSQSHAAAPLASWRSDLDEIGANDAKWKDFVQYLKMQLAIDDEIFFSSLVEWLPADFTQATLALETKEQKVRGATNVFHVVSFPRMVAVAKASDMKCQDARIISDGLVEECTERWQRRIGFAKGAAELAALAERMSEKGVRAPLVRSAADAFTKMREALDSATVDACSQFVGGSTAAWAAKWNANEGFVAMYASACKKEPTDADHPKMLTAFSTPEAAELYSSYKTILNMTNNVVDLVGRLAGKPVADLGGGAAAHGPWGSKAVEWIDSLVASQDSFWAALAQTNVSDGGAALDKWEERSRLSYLASLGVASLARDEALLRFLSDSLASVPLPAPWVMCKDLDGRVFFANAVTRMITWSHPLEQPLKELAGFCHMCLKQPPDALESWIANALGRWEGEAVAVYENWFAVRHESGRAYYCHRQTGASMWENPAQVFLPGHYLKIASVKRLRDEEGLIGALRRTAAPDGAPPEAAERPGRDHERFYSPSLTAAAAAAPSLAQPPRRAAPPLS